VLDAAWIIECQLIAVITDIGMADARDDEQKLEWLWQWRSCSLTPPCTAPSSGRTRRAGRVGAGEGGVRGDEGGGGAVAKPVAPHVCLPERRTRSTRAARGTVDSRVEL
jgi:hypothetical protein